MKVFLFAILIGLPAGCTVPNSRVNWENEPAAIAPAIELRSHDVRQFLYDDPTVSNLGSNIYFNSGSRSRIEVIQEELATVTGISTKRMTHADGHIRFSADPDTHKIAQAYLRGRQDQQFVELNRRLQRQLNGGT